MKQKNLLCCVTNLQKGWALGAKNPSINFFPTPPTDTTSEVLSGNLAQSNTTKKGNKNVGSKKKVSFNVETCFEEFA